ncbi:E1 ubiquitin-activating protein aos1 [Microbotryomycetes sp. JL221]|nr:E1 ubiquitin-activating protein aos1 [Microbotryomycetes sp. JL221]
MADPKHISEEEAALYDRQLRLWGVAAQNRMLTSSVLVYKFKGVAAEVVKNVVLAGVGAVTLLDSNKVNQVDLGANFFLRQQDVGKKRVEAGAPRVSALNPRVTLTTETDDELLHDQDFISQFNLVVLTDVDAPTVLRVNELTRRLGKKLYVVSSIGMDGWIFADLLQHSFIIDTVNSTAPGETAKTTTKQTQSYVSFEKALAHSFSTMRPRQIRQTPDTLWAILSLFATQRASPSQDITIETIESASRSLLPTIAIRIELLSSSTLSRIIECINTEFSPCSAILGGLAGQDVLNILGEKEQAIRNFCLFDGHTCSGNVYQLGLDS